MPQFLRWSHGEALECLGRIYAPAVLEPPRGRCDAGIRCAAWSMASVVSGAASASSCFWIRFAIERQVEQHGALASLVDEVGPGLVVILPDGRHDRHGRSADPAVAGQAGAAHSVLADRHGLDFFRGLSGNRTGVTERLSDCLMVNFRRGVLELPRGAVAREFGALESRKATGRPVVGGGRQKSVVSPASGSAASSIRAGQSAAPMSQNRHSCRDGTRLAGSSADRRRMSAPRFWTNRSSTASGGMRTVWSR